MYIYIPQTKKDFFPSYSTLSALYFLNNNTIIKIM